MIKLFLSTLTIVALLSSNLFAEEKQAPTKSSSKSNEKTYVGIGLGLTEVTGLDTGFSLMLNAGKALPNVSKAFGVEGSFSHSVVDPSINNVDLTVTTVAGYGTFNFELTPKINLMPKVGILYERLSAKATDDSFEATFGFKVLFKLESKQTLYLDYTIIESDIAILSLGMQF